MFDELKNRVNDLFPTVLEELEDLVRIPSVSATDPAGVRRSAEHVAGLLEASFFENVQLLEIDGAHPAVFGEIAAPDGAPTVLLYAHHDVQPAGFGWTEDPWEPRHVGGRLFGRGSSDDKAGIVTHTAAVRAHNGRPPVGVKVFIEGEEEIGSANLVAFLEAYGDLLASDVIVIADAGNWRVGVPSLTVSLRGLVDCVVEVRTLENAVHSGMFGGVFPDALTVLSRLLATLHDGTGNVAIEGLHIGPEAGLDLTEEEVRIQAGALPGVEIIGDGSLEAKTWSRPSVSILGIDAPPVEGAVNAIIPSARAKVSLRLAPGDDPARAMGALVNHLESHVEWGAHVEVIRGASGEAFELDTSGSAYDAFRSAFSEVWGGAPVEMGVGGSIPFVAAFSEAYPDAAILLTGVGDPGSAIHGPNESVEVEDLRKACQAEAIALTLLAQP
ncbi:MAG: dipeptidase [Acidimicrobiia bacterium]|nr:dipeptidase [Acidimicrobiia bacterium]